MQNWNALIVFSYLLPAFISVLYIIGMGARFNDLRSNIQAQPLSFNYSIILRITLLTLDISKFINYSFIEFILMIIQNDSKNYYISGVLFVNISAINPLRWNRILITSECNFGPRAMNKVFPHMIWSNHSWVLTGHRRNLLEFSIISILNHMTFLYYIRNWAHTKDMFGGVSYPTLEVISLPFWNTLWHPSMNLLFSLQLRVRLYQFYKMLKQSFSLIRSLSYSTFYLYFFRFSGFLYIPRLKSSPKLLKRLSNQSNQIEINVFCSFIHNIISIQIRNLDLSYSSILSFIKIKIIYCIMQIILMSYEYKKQVPMFFAHKIYWVLNCLFLSITLALLIFYNGKIFEYSLLVFRVLDYTILLIFTLFIRRQDLAEFEALGFWRSELPIIDLSESQRPRTSTVNNSQNSFLLKIVVKNNGTFSMMKLKLNLICNQF